MMKLRTIFSIGALALSLLVILTPAASASSTKQFTFDNTTTKQVNDLHVEFRQAVTPQPPAGPYGPFTNQSGGGTSKVDFSGGTVAAGGSATITFTSSANDITIEKWWWTINGVRFGVIHTTASAAVKFDQSVVRPGDTVTISLLAVADAVADNSFEIRYSLTSPDGVTQTFPDLSLSVAAGQESHQQLAVPLVSDLGIYTIRFTVVDVRSGAVTKGLSTLEVGTGTIPRSDLDGSVQRKVDL